ncbi:MAG: hypothetical protein GEU90_22060, partial [Gemmatimonas sp.]|nr:hypothetical protein [Gemmatimonas sp.]
MIDVHAHHFPASDLGELKGPSGSVGVAYRSDERILEFPSGPTRPLFDSSADLAIRRSWNAEIGITRQVLSPWMDLTGDDLPKVEALEW